MKLALEIILALIVVGTWIACVFRRGGFHDDDRFAQDRQDNEGGMSYRPIQKLPEAKE